MSDERVDRAPTDEPDGTPAYSASLRPPGDSVHPGGTSDASDDDIAADAAPAGNDAVGGQSGVGAGAGYDTDAVSGDTEIYRPD
jgi:hypothetical protein